MRTIKVWCVLGVATAALIQVPGLQAQQAQAAADPVLERIWQIGTEQSQVPRLAQTFMDSLGPRLTGTPGKQAAHDWTVRMYESWGVGARNEQYGTWTAWQRGITHIDLIAPRVRSLVGTAPAWSGSTNGPVEGPALVLPEVSSLAQFEAWLPRARGAFVAVTPASLSCRPDRHYEQFGTEGALERLRAEQQALNSAWNERRIQSAGLNANQLRARLVEAGAAGLILSSWRGDGEQVVGQVPVGPQRTVPTLNLSCEDYGLVWRLAEHGQGPRLRVNAQHEFLGTAPTYNTIARVPGTEKPDEYVLLSAHFDSWDPASGATDNGTGTVVMMEAMRILSQVYPNPKRTIIAGHWGGEEQGLNGSRAWVTDNPQVVEGLQALFNQDNGTGRVVSISMQGLTGVAPYVQRWLDQVPTEITQHIRLNIPGAPSSGGTDNASFACAGTPAFGLSSLGWAYNPLTHHTNRDTFDKVVMEEVIPNAVLTAMLVYLASEEPDKLPRDRAEGVTWPTCRDGARQAPGGAAAGGG